MIYLPSTTILSCGVLVVGAGVETSRAYIYKYKYIYKYICKKFLFVNRTPSPSYVGEYPVNLFFCGQDTRKVRKTLIWVTGRVHSS